MTPARTREARRVVDELHFLLTNRIPRRSFTRFMAWFSRIEQPWVRDLSLAAWQRFSDLDLTESRTTRFRSVHECFTRQLKPDARPIDTDPGVVASPCDGIVGSCGRIDGTTLVQAKGFPYGLDELLGDRALAERLRDGFYVTLRLTPSMYHRFHAPHDCRVREVRYTAGDVWNVTPATLRRIERLFCRNERATIVTELGCGAWPVALVAVAAVLVAGIRLHFLDTLLHLDYRGPRVFPCDAVLCKGQEMGWFEHGSTIIVVAPDPLVLADPVREGARVRMGQALLRLPTQVGALR